MSQRLLESDIRKESYKKGTPFVEVDPVVCNYVRDYGDKRVKEMFCHFVEDGSEATVLFPY